MWFFLSFKELLWKEWIDQILEVYPIDVIVSLIADQIADPAHKYVSYVQVPPVELILWQVQHSPSSGNLPGPPHSRVILFKPKLVEKWRVATK